MAREDVFVRDPQFDAYSVNELRQRLQISGRPERARAIGALARRAASDETLQDEIFAKLQDPELRAERVTGTISLAHIALACLLIAAGSQLAARAKQLASSWPEPDRSDLVWFLRTQGLSLD